MTGLQLEPGSASYKWVTQQSFPEPSRKSNGDYLLGLQSESPKAKVRFWSNDESLTDGVYFQIVTSPIGPLFRLEYSLYPPSGQNRSTSEVDKDSRTRMVAEFLAYDPDSSAEYKNRKVYQYTSKDNNKPIGGPITFSNMLIGVSCWRGNYEKLDEKYRNPDADKAGREAVFRWQAKYCKRYGFSQFVPQERQAGANQFKRMVNAIEQAYYLMVIVPPAQRALATVYWPFFCAMPIAMPSYFPWLGELDPQDWEQLIQIAPGRSFERYPELTKVMFALRSRDWFKGNEVATASMPSADKLRIAALDPIFKFQDDRHYLAAVLGSYLYEYEHARSEVGNFYNGYHKCEILSKDGPSTGTRLYMVLLSIRPRRTDVGAEAPLPRPGERVSIRITINGAEQNWTGYVVEIPSNLKQLGRNVAVQVKSSPAIPQSGRIMEQSKSGNADFYFGHHGQNISLTMKNLLALMTGNVRKNKSGLTSKFLRDVVLARDLHHTLSPSGTGNTVQSHLYLPFPLNTEAQMNNRINQVCRELGLDANQTDIVRHYFSHRVTLVRGPGGTGKSTLINAVIRLEEEFGQKHWVCTDSNEACDVLVKKTCERRRTTQPARSLRVRPMFEERLDYSVDQQMLFRPKDVVAATPELGPGENAFQAVQRYLESAESKTRSMSLENLIKQRLQLWLSGKLQSTVWADEEEDYRALAQAAIAFEGLQVGNLNPEEFAEEQQRLERGYDRQLRKIQEQHVANSLGVYSTSAAAAGPLLRRFAPRGIIMDESSQALEASAVAATVHAIQQGSVQRWLLVGDDQQLPPTVMNQKNPFRSTAAISLFERLIQSGAPVFNLSVQYRSEASISSIVASQIYRPIGLNLLNGARSAMDQTEDTRFRDFVAKFAAKMGTQTVGATNAIVISPVEPKDKLNWKSQSVRGSTSKFNLTTARIVCHTVYQLVDLGKYKGKDILVITFYKDQAELLDSILRLSNLADIKVSTVDGSQGQQRPVTIVDCVVLGAANGDGMGFLNADKRRFCVSMMRAQYGRIVVAHKNMRAASTQGPRTVWDELLAESSRNNAILDGTPFNTAIPAKTLQEAMVNAFQKSSSATSSGASGKVQGSGKRPVINYERMAFIQATGATVDRANQYLAQYNDLPVAIDKYLHDHGNDLEIEEI